MEEAREEFQLKFKNLVQESRLLRKKEEQKVDQTPIKNLYLAQVKTPDISVDPIKMQKISAFVKEKYSEELNLHVGRQASVKAGRGRPKKDKSEKVRNISIKLSPEYIRYLYEAKFSAPKTSGAGGKIKHIINEYSRLKKRENAELKVLKSNLSEITNALNLVAARTEGREGLLSMEKLEKSIGNVKLLISLYCYEIVDLKKFLSKEDYRSVELCLGWGR